MAYPVIAATYGFNPVQRLDGLTYAGVTRTFPIASGSALPIFHGDMVGIDLNGNLVKANATVDNTAAGVLTVGIFIGCSYTNPSTLQPLFYNFYQGGVVAPDIEGIFVDDPFALFKVVSVNAVTNAIAPFSRAIVGANVSVNATVPGNTLNGISGLAINGSTAASTPAFPFRVVDVVPETGDGQGNFFEFIVKFNNHQYLINTGV